MCGPRTETTYEWWMGEFEEWWALEGADLASAYDRDLTIMDQFTKNLAEQSWRAALDICG